MDQTDQGLGAVWREKSFGQRLKFGAGGGKFVPLGPRTIFLDRPKRPIHLPIIRKSQSKEFRTNQCSKKTVSICVTCAHEACPREDGELVSVKSVVFCVKIGNIFRQFSIKNADTSEQKLKFSKNF